MGKKIGIITLWDSQDNYGQVLQCYALQRYLIKNHQEAYLIKTVSDTLAPQSPFRRLLNLPKKVLTYRFWSLLYFRYKLRVFDKRFGIVNRHFDDFRDKFINSTKAVYDISALRNNPPDADIYITGSDQVWGGPSELYFLNFTPKGKRKYSYAASFGSNPFTKDGCSKMENYLSDFSEVTVREESGVAKCKLLGIDATRIIDPTGLLTASDYMSIAECESSENYILLYLLGNFTDVDIDEVFNFAKAKKMSVKYIASQGRNDKYDKIFPSPTEWIGLIANAKYIITNSYHCCMFSIYFEKKFMALPLTGIFKKMNVRMDTLFGTYHIPRVKSLDELLSSVFDYSSITQCLEEDRHKAMKIIDKWIK